MLNIVDSLSYIFKICNVSEAIYTSFIRREKGKFPAQLGLLELVICLIRGIIE
jgi:hypothetical protein